jgi:sugar/nucleoside kinase (ribokinase family)
MKVLGIGNAIVDVLCKVSDQFLIKNNLQKSTMKLVDKNEFKKLLSSLKIEETISGGSVANTIVGLAQCGNDVGFIGKVNDDDFGLKYEISLSKKNVKYLYNKKKEILSTGTCLILITPDSERTMCTFLGTSGAITDHDIDENEIKKSELVLLEGYLWDKGEPKKAFDKAIKYAAQTAMSLSDIFCVERHKENFLDLISNKLNIIFSNEQEIMALINAKKFDDVIQFSKKLKKHIIITRGDNGSIAIYNEKVIECSAKKNLKIVDLTGAGDMFAAGYLDSYLKKMTIKECLYNGTILASKIIEKIGARL